MYTSLVDTERGCVRTNREGMTAEDVGSKRHSLFEVFDVLSDETRLEITEKPWENEVLMTVWKGTSDLTKNVQETYIDVSGERRFNVRDVEFLQNTDTRESSELLERRDAVPEVA